MGSIDERLVRAPTYRNPWSSRREIMFVDTLFERTGLRSKAKKTSQGASISNIFQIRVREGPQH